MADAGVAAALVDAVDPEGAEAVGAARAPVYGAVTTAPKPAAVTAVKMHAAVIATTGLEAVMVVIAGKLRKAAVAVNSIYSFTRNIKGAIKWHRPFYIEK